MKKENIEVLFRQYYNKMIRLARRMLYDVEESRDVVSEVFATLIKTNVIPTNVEAYLLMSVRNRCINILQHKEVKKRFEQAYIIEQSEAHITDTIALNIVEEEQRLTLLLNYAEQNLPEQTLRVFRMRHIKSMKYQEIAEELGISRVMVYKHLTKAMQIIREYNNQNK